MKTTNQLKWLLAAGMIGLGMTGASTLAVADQPTGVQPTLNHNPPFKASDDASAPGHRQQAADTLDDLPFDDVVNACVADFDLDGIVATDDLLMLVSAWDTPDGDLNGDGLTDIRDLLILISNWGACP